MFPKNASRKNEKVLKHINDVHVCVSVKSDGNTKFFLLKQSQNRWAAILHYNVGLIVVTK